MAGGTSRAGSRAGSEAREPNNTNWKVDSSEPSNTYWKVEARESSNIN